MVEHHHAEVLQAEVLQHRRGGRDRGLGLHDHGLVPHAHPVAGEGIGDQRTAARSPALVSLEADDDALSAAPLLQHGADDSQRTIAEVGAHLQHREGLAIVAEILHRSRHCRLDDVSLLPPEVHAQPLSLAVLVEAGDQGVYVTLLVNAHGRLEDVVHLDTPPITVRRGGEPIAFQLPGHAGQQQGPREAEQPSRRAPRRTHCLPSLASRWPRYSM
mmetsp:Transcript_19430/g.44225  ORF Transcript_19430/g.44225 Transcript_19430/m.44225 type:complete len:216 (-) Transcript_19430:49-696(-)